MMKEYTKPGEWSKYGKENCNKIFDGQFKKWGNNCEKQARKWRNV